MIFDSLLSEERRVRVRRIALHAVVRDVDGLRDSIAPEGGRVNRKVADRAPRCVEDSQRERTTVAVLARVGGEVLPPWLS